MKFCVDCKYHKPVGYSYHECMHLTNSIIGMVTGQRTCIDDCKDYRKNKLTSCGIEAKYWSPSFWYRIKQLLRLV
jgi:hypothetical protein